MSAPPDHYRILHVQPDAPAAIIHASYRTLVQRALGASGGGDEIAQLDPAYAILGDPQRRAAYDLERMAQTGVHDAASDPTGTRGTHNCLFCGAAHGLTRVLERDDECGQCASPLFAAERHRFEYSGQRMLNRIPKQRAIEILGHVAARGAAARRDAQPVVERHVVHSTVRLQLNQVVRIDCSELRALARVAHVEHDPESRGHFSAGVEFLTLRFRQDPRQLRLR